MMALPLEVFVDATLRSFINLQVVTFDQRSSEHRLSVSRKLFRCATRICIAASLGLIAAALWQWGAAEVRGWVGAVLYLTALGAFWLGLSSKLFSLLGLSVRDDAMERKNPAALVALCCALV